MKEAVLFEAQGCYSSFVCGLLISWATHKMPGPGSSFTEMVQMEIPSGGLCPRAPDLESYGRESLHWWVKEDHQLTMQAWGRVRGAREEEGG